MQQIYIRDILELGANLDIEGDDAHHLIRVVRIKPGEKIRVSNHEGDSYLAEVTSVDDGVLGINILEELSSSELDKRIVLFQGVAKSDRMEYIIQKATELGVAEIVPVEMKYCVARVDDKKKASKIKRYESITLSAAQQSKRSVVPTVSNFLKYSEALEYAKSLDTVVVAYEAHGSMEEMKSLLDKIRSSESIGIFIGPEGGFSDDEIDAVSDFELISLGRRILRTDTAAIASLSALMLYLEIFR